jgi:hypothetical protein
MARSGHGVRLLDVPDWAGHFSFSQEHLFMQSPKSLRHRARTGLAVLGAAALLVGGLNVVSYAATGGPMLLGKGNTASKTTKLKTTGNKAALKLKSKAGSPALAVSNSVLIAKLNADLVDGKSLDELEPTTQTFSIGTAGAPGSGASQYFQTTSLPSGNYLVSMDGTIQAGAGDSNTCTVLDLTRYNTGDVSAIFVYDSTDPDGGVNSMSGSLLAPIVAGNRLVFACQLDTTSTVIQPLQFRVKRIDRSGAIPGVGPTVFPRQGARSPLAGLN